MVPLRGGGYTANMSRDGILLRRMQLGRQREGGEPPREDWTRPSRGDGAGRGRRDWEEAMATSRDLAKKRVRASESSGWQSGTRPSGGVAESRRAERANMRQSAEKCPSGRLEKVSRATAQGVPTRRAPWVRALLRRRAWKKAHMLAGKGRGRLSQRAEPEPTGNLCTGQMGHRRERGEATRQESWE